MAFHARSPDRHCYTSKRFSYVYGTSHGIDVLDEAYQGRMYAKNEHRLKRNRCGSENLIVLRTFSKMYGLAGGRAGDGISGGQIATQLNSVRGPFIMSIPTQRVAL